jgi:hypothetical protein
MKEPKVSEKKGKTAKLSDLAKAIKAHRHGDLHIHLHPAAPISDPAHEAKESAAVEKTEHETGIEAQD